MMNFQVFLFTANLTTMIISFLCVLAICSPICSIIRNVSPTPGWALFSFDICRLPFPHAWARTEVVGFYFRILPSKFFSTPVAVDNLASPSQQYCLTCQTTCELDILLDSVWFHYKLDFADWTGKGGGGGVTLTVCPLTGIGTKPKSSGVSFNVAFKPVKSLGTV